MNARQRHALSMKIRALEVLRFLPYPEHGLRAADLGRQVYAPGNLTGGRMPQAYARPGAALVWALRTAGMVGVNHAHHGTFWGITDRGQHFLDDVGSTKKEPFDETKWTFGNLTGIAKALAIYSREKWASNPTSKTHASA